jgi:hypothetical protein
VLLVPTVIYAVAVRRRIRAIAQARAEVSQANRVPYAHNAAGDLDLMSEYFSPIVTDSDAPGRAGSASGNGGNGAAAAGTAAGGLLARSVMPATRLNVARPPKVSGTPPWEPAPKPDGELPWAGRSLPSRPRRNVPAHLVPAPTASLRTPEPTAGARDQDLAADSSAADAEGAARLYVWNPGSTTEGSPGNGGTDAAADRATSAGDLGEGADRYSGEPAADRDARGYGDGEPPAYRDLHPEFPGYNDPDDLTAYRAADPPGYRDSSYADPDPFGAHDSDLPGYSSSDLPGYRDPGQAAYADKDFSGYGGDDPLAFRAAEPPAFGDQDTGTYPGHDLPAYGESSAYRDGQASSGDDLGYGDSAATPGDGDRHTPDSRY